ncbi:MAG: hypothetical protein ACJAT0_002563 [Nonlabens sp.]|jgi:hypothetical protein
MFITSHITITSTTPTSYKTKILEPSSQLAATVVQLSQSLILSNLHTAAATGLINPIKTGIHQAFVDKPKLYNQETVSL